MERVERENAVTSDQSLAVRVTFPPDASRNILNTIRCGLCVASASVQSSCWDKYFVILDVEGCDWLKFKIFIDMI